MENPLKKILDKHINPDLGESLRENEVKNFDDDHDSESLREDALFSQAQKTKPYLPDMYQREAKRDIEVWKETLRSIRFDPENDYQRIIGLEESLDLYNKDSFLAKELQVELDDLLIERDGYEDVTARIKNFDKTLEGTTHKFQNQESISQEVKKQNPYLN